MALNQRTPQSSEALRTAIPLPTKEWRRGRLYSVVVLPDGPVSPRTQRVSKKARFPRKARNG